MPLHKYHFNKLNISEKDLRSIEDKSETYRKMLVELLNDFRRDLVGVNLDDSNWVIKRAYYDGKLSAYNSLIKLIGDPEWK
jgi:hypothetical protein